MAPATGAPAPELLLRPLFPGLEGAGEQQGEHEAVGRPAPLLLPALAWWWSALLCPVPQLELPLLPLLPTLPHPLSHAFLSLLYCQGVPGQGQR